MKLIPKSFGHLAGITSTDKVRYPLSGVLIESDQDKIRGIATDGNQLIIAESNHIPQDDYPKLGLNNKDFDKALVPADALFQISKYVPKNPINKALENFAIAKDKNEITLACTDLENKHVEKTWEIEGTFPDWKAVVPKDNQGVEIIIDAAKMIKFLKTIMNIAELRGTRNKYDLPAVKLQIKDKTSAIKATAFNKDKSINVTGVFMPITRDI